MGAPLTHTHSHSQSHRLMQTHTDSHVMPCDTFKIANKTTAKLCVLEWGTAHRKSKITCTSALLCLSISATHVVTELVNINSPINLSVAAHHDGTKALSQTTTSATI